MAHLILNTFMIYFQKSNIKFLGEVIKSWVNDHLQDTLVHVLERLTLALHVELAQPDLDPRDVESLLQ